MINIISGNFKNSLLKFPKYFYKCRFFKPTFHHIKKKLFNWLGCLKNFSCLDIFSGSGSLAFEAASRGCKISTLFEKNNKIFFYLKKNLNRLNIKNLKLFNLNFFNHINNINFNIYNLIFIDSPYIILKKLINSIKIILKFLKSGSIVYVETIFEIKLVIKNFKNKIKILKNDFFNKINFFLFQVL